MSRTSVKRSGNFDLDESVENAPKMAKTNSSGNYWLYIKADSENICKIAMKNRSFEKSLAEITKSCPLEMEKTKFFISKGILRISCRNEAQQDTLAKLRSIDGHPVTVTLPWALTKSNENDHVFHENKQKPRIFKYVLSGVCVDITDDEIAEATKCAEVNRISKQDGNKLVKTETVILSFESEQTLPCTIHFGMLKIKLRAYVPSPMRCKNCLGYGHTSKHCTHQSRCLHCGNVGHNYDACVTKNQAIRCANCGGGHTALDKTCPKFIQARDRLKRTAAEGRPTYSRALGSVTNKATAAAPDGTPNAVNKTTSHEQLNSAIIDSIKIDCESSLEKFAANFTADIQKVLVEYGSEIKKIKTAITEIRDHQKELETKIQKLECIDIDILAKIKPEIETEHQKTTDYCDAVARHVIDSLQLLIFSSKNLELTPSMARMKKQNEHYHLELTRTDVTTTLSKRYWSEKEENQELAT